MLLEQASLTCGTTWHSSSMLNLYQPYAEAQKMALMSKNLYQELQKNG